MYKILDIGEHVIPDFVYRSSKYRDLRAAISQADIDEPIYVLPEEQTEKGVNSLQNACYTWQDVKGVPDVKVKTRTFTINGDLPDGLLVTLMEQGASDGDTVVSARKVRLQ
jgi:hypothetical protein